MQDTKEGKSAKKVTINNFELRYQSLVFLFEIELYIYQEYRLQINDSKGF